MTTNLNVSPCRGCAKQLKIYCRNRCRKLKDYQLEAIGTVSTRDYGTQYSGDVYGIRKQIPRKNLPLALEDTPISDEDPQLTSFHGKLIGPDKSRPMPRHY